MNSLKKYQFNLILGIFLEVVFALNQAWSAPCCARSSATPVLIVGDDQSQINFGIALGNVVAEVTEEGIPYFKSADTNEVTQTYRMDGATLLSDRFQVGASVNLVNHTVMRPDASGSDMGVGDSRISFGYEVLPRWTYSSWKPQGYLFTVLTLPTGRSVYESQRPTLSDITGNGFYSVSLGTLMMKRWGRWDAFVIPEGHYSFSRTFQNNDQNIQIVPGFGGSIGVGGGFSPGEGSFRFGLRVQPRYDQARLAPSVDGDGQGAPITLCDTGLDVSYLMNDTNTLLFSFTDQTLLGSPINTNLNRVFALNFQHRWER